METQSGGQCQECGRDIGKRRRNKKFCSSACRFAFWRKNKAVDFIRVPKQTFEDMQKELDYLRKRVAELRAVDRK